MLELLLAVQLWSSFDLNDPAMLLNGTWQSCRTAEGDYAEAVVDFPKQNVQLHMGPYHEFALFRGTPLSHKLHNGPLDLFHFTETERLAVGNRLSLHREVTVGGEHFHFEAVIAGGSREDCETFVLSFRHFHK